MSTTPKDRYLAHYAPLIQGFVREIEDLKLEIPPGTPQPFFPLFGERYERSSLRMAIVGRDTRGWGCLKTFLETEKAAPGAALEADLEEFQNRDFTAWGTTRYTFWGFAMMFLAALHGRSDWGVMKRGACVEILSSFVWGNGNAVELYGSSPKQVPWEDWERIRKAGERFDKLFHIVDSLQPRVVVVLWKEMDPASYFAGYDHTRVDDRDGVRHYRIPSSDLDIFHVPHPGRMRWEGIPAEHYCAQLVARLLSNRLTVEFPNFVRECEKSEDVLRFLRTSALGPSAQDKFQFVEWVAEELAKRASFMSVPTLCTLLNGLGYETDYGEEYTGGRGAYRLISGTYHRLDNAGKGDRAQMVAEAFRQPNFEYAYDV
jgi:hypothetical protein